MKRLFFLFAFVFLMFSTVEVQAASCDDDVGTIENLNVTIDLVATQTTLFSQAKETLATSKKVEVLGSENKHFGNVFTETYKPTKHEDDRNSYFKSYLRDNLVRLDKNLTKLQDQNNTYFMSYLRNS